MSQSVAYEQLSRIASVHKVWNFTQLAELRQYCFYGNPGLILPHFRFVGGQHRLLGVCEHPAATVPPA